jgi:type IV fimbrial biogenesis protein FimT
MNSHNKVSRSGRGFTLIELMVTVAVVAILAAIAVPNLRAFILRNALTTSTSELRAVLARARVEAVNRATVVSVTPGSTTGASTVGWTGGFLLFVNPMNGQTLALASSLGVSGTDRKTAKLLQQGDFYDQNTVSVTTASSGGAMTRVSYGADGRLAGVSNGTLTFCVDPNVVTTENARIMEVSPDGRVSITRATLSPCPAAS